MKGIFALDFLQELKLEPLLSLPDVTEDKEKRAKAETLMKPVDVRHIKIPADMTDEKFDQVIYREPVITCIGNTYESEKISAWLENNNTDPADNTELDNKNLISNKAYLSRVNSFLDKNPQLRDSAELYLPRRWVAELEFACGQGGDLDTIKRLYDLDRRLFSWTFDFTEEKYSVFQGKNILHIICARGKVEAIIRVLEFIEKRVEGLALLMLLQRDKHGKLPIQYAMGNNANALLMRSLLLKMGKHLKEIEPVPLPASKTQENRYRNTLHIAAMNNDANAISFLIEHKSDLNIKDESGNTALHIAVGYGANAAVQVLIKAGASEVIENDHGQTPEKVGEVMGKAETVQALKEALEQRSKTQQHQLKDAGPLAQMVLGMKTALDQLAVKTQNQERQIDELQTAITLLHHEIGYLRLTGHFLNRETLYDRRHKQSSNTFFGFPFPVAKASSEGGQTLWEPKQFGIDKPLTNKELRKLVLEDLPPHTEKALFYVEEKGLSKNYQFSELKNGEHFVTAVDILPNGHIISGYSNGFIRAWDFKGSCIKSFEASQYGGKISSIIVLPDGGFISCSGTVVKIWNNQGKCLNTIETKDESGRWNYGNVRCVAVLPDGKIIVGEGNSLKIWEQKGECTATIALGKPEYKRLIVDSSAPVKMESEILYITVDEKNKQCNIRSTDIQSPINFGDNQFSRLTRLLRSQKSAEFGRSKRSVELDLPQDITETSMIESFNEVLKFNQPPNLTALTVWNDRIVVGLDDNSIQVLKKDGKSLRKLLGHSIPVCALSAPAEGNLVSVDGDGTAKFWDNEFKCVETRLFNTKSITNIKTFPDGTLVVSTNEKIMFWNKTHGYLLGLAAKGPFAVHPDTQAIFYASENIIKYVFVGKPQLLYFSFQKDLLLANAKLYRQNQGLVVKTVRPCLKELIAFGAVLQKLCSELQLNIEFAKTEMRILNLTDAELIADLENLCQLFGAAKFIPAPADVIKQTTQVVFEEAKRHRITGSPIPPLSSPITVMGSKNKPGLEPKKDYFNTKENDSVMNRTNG
jgi:WD40 repeat protein/ankyrin repeat protein